MARSCAGIRRCQVFDRRSNDSSRSRERSQEPRYLLVEQVCRSGDTGFIVYGYGRNRNLLPALTTKRHITGALLVEECGIDPVAPGEKNLGSAYHLARRKGGDGFLQSARSL
jgi:hypothetical protein